MPRESMRVMIRGEVYDSVKEAAEHFGLPTSSVYVMVDAGRSDYIGTGKGSNNAKSVEILGLQFSSYSEMARELGISFWRARNICSFRDVTQYKHYNEIKERIDLYKSQGTVNEP